LRRHLLHTWRLGVEEQFYVIFPLILVAAWARAAASKTSGASPRTVAAAIAGLSGLSFLVSLLWWHGWEIGRGEQSHRARVSRRRSLERQARVAAIIARARR
jgi:peptidoglycan/LPS O-acetylase OafA/YrhL